MISIVKPQTIAECEQDIETITRHLKRLRALKLAFERIDEPMGEPAAKPVVTIDHLPTAVVAHNSPKPKLANSTT